MATGKKAPQPGVRTHGLCSNTEFQPRKLPLWLRFFTSNHCLSINQSISHHDLFSDLNVLGHIYLNQTYHNVVADKRKINYCYSQLSIQRLLSDPNSLLQIHSIVSLPSFSLIPRHASQLKVFHQQCNQVFVWCHHWNGFSLHFTYTTSQYI